MTDSLVLPQVSGVKEKGPWLCILASAPRAAGPSVSPSSFHESDSSSEAPSIPVLTASERYQEEEVKGYKYKPL